MSRRRTRRRTRRKSRRKTRRHRKKKRKTKKKGGVKHKFRKNCLTSIRTSDNLIEPMEMYKNKFQKYCGYDDYKIKIKNWCQNQDKIDGVNLKRAAKIWCDPKFPNDIQMLQLFLADNNDQRVRNRNNKTKRKSFRSAFYDAEV